MRKPSNHPPSGRRAPTLRGLEVLATAGGAGDLEPAFSETCFAYCFDVQSDIREVLLTARVRRLSGSTIRVDGRPVRSGRSTRIELSVGDNPLRVELADRRGRRAAYCLRVRREDIRPVADRFGRFVFRDPETGVTMGYRLFVPGGYDPLRSYPLVLFLHGAGESGSDNEIHLVQNEGATIWAKPQEQDKRPCFVLAPQNPKDPRATEPGDFGTMGWTSLLGRGFSDPFRPEPALRRAHAILREVMGQYSIDRNRVYATGLSMGAFGVFAMAVEHPDLFAALAAVCGGLDPSRTASIAHLPVWVFHGAQDPVVDVSLSRQAVQALAEAGGRPRYTEYGRETHLHPDAHCSWVPAYADPKMRQWLFGQSRNKP